MFPADLWGFLLDTISNSRCVPRQDFPKLGPTEMSLRNVVFFVDAQHISNRIAMFCFSKCESFCRNVVDFSKMSIFHREHRWIPQTANISTLSFMDFVYNLRKRNNFQWMFHVKIRRMAASWPYVWLLSFSFSFSFSLLDPHAPYHASTSRVLPCTQFPASPRASLFPPR